MIKSQFLKSICLALLVVNLIPLHDSKYPIGVFSYMNESGSFYVPNQDRTPEGWH
jgi:hypothetical protein